MRLNSCGQWEDWTREAPDRLGKRYASSRWLYDPCNHGCLPEPAERVKPRRNGPTMLQIASGKLFGRKPGQRNELRGVLYTNLRMYNRTIETAAGRLLSTSTLHDSKTLVYEFTELIEDEPGAGVIASHGIDPYLSDFAAVVSFALNVTCTLDPDLTFRLLNGRQGPSVQYPPSKLIARVFDDTVWCQPEDEAQLFELVGQLISLERKSFLAAMRAIRSYVTGLHRLADDYELAYTLLVVSIESLAQEFDGFQPQWEDYDQRKRRAIDDALTGADEVMATRVREALLQTEHVALRSRFCEFTLDHLQPSYFREEAQDLANPAGRTDLDRALRQAYDLRSNYIHKLAELPTILKLPGFGEISPLDRDLLLTLQGLARLARHVITTFIQKRPKVHREEYAYRFELPGIVRVEMEPRYWVGRADNLRNQAGRRRLEGFLKQATAYLLREPNASVTNLQDVLTQVEGMLPGMNADHQRPFIALYVLFNVMARKARRWRTMSRSWSDTDMSWMTRRWSLCWRCCSWALFPSGLWQSINRSTTIIFPRGTGRTG